MSHIERIAWAVLFALGLIVGAAISQPLPPINVSGQEVLSTSQFPAGAIPFDCAGTGSTAAVSCTLEAYSGRLTYICGFDVSAVGGTAAISPVTVTGLAGSVSTTFTYQLPPSVATGGVVYSHEFSPCIPTQNTNTPIIVTTTADATATAVDVNAHGYLQ